MTSGGTPSKSNPAFWGGSIPWLSAKDMKTARIFDTEDHVTALGAANGTRLAKEGATLLLVRGMTLLSDVPICSAGRDLTFNQDVKALVAKPGVDPDFLFYSVLAAKPALLGMVDLAGHGTGRLPTDRVQALPIWLPEPTEQRTIASVLRTVDAKIDLNRQMNATLEAAARTLFKSWFVDFDPVLAKAEGRLPVGMDAATAELFPGAVVRNGGGQMPTGWHYRTVGDLCGALFDGPHATPPEASEGPIFLGIRNLPGSTVDLADVRHISESDWPAWTRRVEPREGDIVFTYEATLGHFALLPPGIRCCLGRRTALLRLSGSDPVRHFLFHWLISPPFQEFLRSRVHPGATVDRILLSDFPSYPVMWPGERLAQRFEAVAAPIWKRAHANEAESRTLVNLRDALLPKLLTGELRVRAAEKAVEQVA